MFTRKDREIANLEQKVENRDNLIANLEQQKNYYKLQAREQREVIKELERKLKEIEKLTTSNTYGNDRVVLDKIKELTQTAIRN